MSFGRIVLSVIILGLPITSARASWEGAVEVYQPTITGEGIQLTIVTYVLHWGTYWPSKEISKTCAENCIVTQRGHENRNLANRMGLTVHVVRNPDDQAGLFSDTLRVSVNTAGLRPDSLYTWVSPDTAVAATLECVLGNAKRDSRVRFLEIQVIGNDRYKPLGKVWDLDVITNRPRRRIFGQ